MIIIERTITIKNDQATLDSPIYLYRGDGDIICLFTIKEMKKSATFGKIESNNPVSQAAYGNVRIYKPDGSKCVFTEKAPIVDDKLQVTFSYENINDFAEVGVHKLQIHLYDDNDAHDESNDKNRFTLPPIDINVLLPIGDYNAQVDEAIVGYSLLDVADEVIDTFDENGNYNMTVWETGDVITQGKLNKLEEALHQVTVADDNFVTTEAFETAIAGKADEGHTHYGYATTDQLSSKAERTHTHSGYAASGHNHNGVYAASDHNHNGIYAPSSHTHTNYATTDQLESHTHKEYATTTQLDNKAEKNHDHGEYALKTEISTVPTKLSQLTNDKGYITSDEIPAKYVTEKELSDYDYITKSYADGYFASTDFVRSEINKAAFPDAGDYNINFDAYALKSEVASTYATKAELQAVEDKIDNIDLSEIEGFITEDEVDAKISAIELTPGPQGPQGPQGEQGLPGEQGPQGEQGPAGADGAQGPAGQDGKDGAAFTYDMFTEEQLAALVGPEGPQGQQGEQGLQGEQGVAGQDGKDFTYDMFTEEQLALLVGPQGERGPQGPMGPQGDKGDKGDKGDTGEQGPAGADGTVSFDELTDAQRELLRGPQGIQGEVGPQGVQGEKGDQGIQGIQGPRGYKGDKGDKGDPFTYDDLTDEQRNEMTKGFITCSDNIKRIEIVTKYPDNPEENVLYIRVEG